MIMEDEGRPELRDKIDDAMRRIPEIRVRYAGKTIPPEKFAVAMAEVNSECDSRAVNLLTITQ